MGCCQSSSPELSNQVYFQLNNEQFFDEESKQNVFSDSEKNSFNKTPSKTSVYGSIDQKIVFLEKTLETHTVVKYFCGLNNNNSTHEAVVFSKQNASTELTDYILESLIKLAHVSHDNILKIMYIEENYTSITLITEECSKFTLKQLLKNRNFDEAYIINYFQQIIRGIIKCFKNKIMICQISLDDTYLINNSVKISPTISIPLVNEQNLLNYKSSESSIVDNLGIILLQMISWNSCNTDIRQILTSLAQDDLYREDFYMIQNIFSLDNKPSLRELGEYSWKISRRSSVISRNIEIAIENESFSKKSGSSCPSIPEEDSFTESHGFHLEDSLKKEEKIKMPGVFFDITERSCEFQTNMSDIEKKQGTGECVEEKIVPADRYNRCLLEISIENIYLDVKENLNTEKSSALYFLTESQCEGERLKTYDENNFGRVESEKSVKFTHSDYLNTVLSSFSPFIASRPSSALTDKSFRAEHTEGYGKNEIF